MDLHSILRIGEFCLSHKNIQMPIAGNYYSVNQGYYLKFDLEIRWYIDHCSDLNYRLRYIGSMGTGYPPHHVSGWDIFIPQDKEVSQR